MSITVEMGQSLHNANHILKKVEQIFKIILTLTYIKLSMIASSCMDNSTRHHSEFGGLIFEEKLAIVDSNNNHEWNMEKRKKYVVAPSNWNDPNYIFNGSHSSNNKVSQEKTQITSSIRPHGQGRPLKVVVGLKIIRSTCKQGPGRPFPGSTKQGRVEGEGTYNNNNNKNKMWLQVSLHSKTYHELNYFSATALQNRHIKDTAKSHARQTSLKRGFEPRSKIRSFKSLQV